MRYTRACVLHGTSRLLLPSSPSSSSHPIAAHIIKALPFTHILHSARISDLHWKNCIDIMSAHPLSRAVRISQPEAIEVRFGGFEGLPSRIGQDFVHSPDFSCLGHTWFLRIYPGGSSESDGGKVSIYLHHKSTGPIRAQATIMVKKSDSKI